jgi:hypothetical protein
MKGLLIAPKIITFQNKEARAHVLTERANYCTNIEKYNKSNFKLTPTTETPKPPYSVRERRL